jgi:hypothetical protein
VIETCVPRDILFRGVVEEDATTYFMEWDTRPRPPVRDPRLRRPAGFGRMMPQPKRQPNRFMRTFFLDGHFRSQLKPDSCGGISNRTNRQSGWYIHRPETSWRFFVG